MFPETGQRPTWWHTKFPRLRCSRWEVVESKSSMTLWAFDLNSVELLLWKCHVSCTVSVCYLLTVREQMRLYKNRMTPWPPSSLNYKTHGGKGLFSGSGLDQLKQILDLLTHWMWSRMNFMASPFLSKVNSCSWNAQRRRPVWRRKDKEYRQDKTAPSLWNCSACSPDKAWCSCPRLPR